MRGADWRAGAAQRIGAQCDARRRVARALPALAPQLRRAVEMACLREGGLETLERTEGWPARSGNLALKLALAQLATRRG